MIQLTETISVTYQEFQVLQLLCASNEPAKVTRLIQIRNSMRNEVADIVLVDTYDLFNCLFSLAKKGVVDKTTVEIQAGYYWQLKPEFRLKLAEHFNNQS